MRGVTFVRGDPVVVKSRVTGEEFHGEITVVKPKMVGALWPRGVQDLTQEKNTTSSAAWGFKTTTNSLEVRLDPCGLLHVLRSAVAEDGVSWVFLLRDYLWFDGLCATCHPAPGW